MNFAGIHQGVMALNRYVKNANIRRMLTIGRIMREGSLKEIGDNHTAKEAIRYLSDETKEAEIEEETKEEAEKGDA
mgnify:CR=1 FL=1